MLLTALPSRTGSVPRTAMILAAGYGRRMRPLSDRMPKPLLDINGTPMLDMILGRLFAVSVERVVINASYMKEKLVAHVDALHDARIRLSLEAEPLETGGGVLNALPALGDQPFFVVNGDSIWVDGMKSALLRLAEAWDPARMDILLTLAPLVRVPRFDGRGDFTMAQDGRLARRGEASVAPYAFMGLSILAPPALDGMPDGAFSLNRAYDRAIEAGRLFGIVHDGLWYHVSTPTDLGNARARFANGHRPDVPFF